MNPPLIVLEGRDVGLFASEEALTLKLEPPDVREGVYTVFDSRGRRVELGVEAGDLEAVLVTSIELEPAHEDELRAGLISGLVAGFGEAPGNLERLPLSELVDLAVHRYGFEE